MPKKQLGGVVRKPVSSGLADGGTITSATRLAANTFYWCDHTAASYTNVMPAASVDDEVMLIKFGTFAMTIDLNGQKFNGSTANPVTSAEGITRLRFTGASRGWVEM